MGHAEMQKLDPSLGKSIDLNCGRELEDPGNNMNYEIAEFMRIAEANGSAEKHNQYSIWEMQVMDEARRQMGIVFPADRV